jgi:hypothetical protein
MNYKFKIAFLLISAISVSISGNAQQVFYSQQLQNLYRLVPNVCIIDTDITDDTVVMCHNVVQDDTVLLIYHWDENRVLEHIGCQFLQNDSITINNVIVRFIERELLAILLSCDIKQTLVSHRENGLSVLLNNVPVSQHLLQDKRQLLNLIKHNNGIAINYDNKKYYGVTLFSVDKQELSFYFRPDSELLTGMDNKEQEIRLAVQLKNHKAKLDSIVSPDYSYLQLLRDSVYVKKGSSFMIPQINNDLFYIKADSVYNLAFDTSFIAESFSNALLVPAMNDYTINIMHRMYGKIVKKYTVCSRDFYDYFSHDYDCYFGIESLEKEKLTGTLILNDRNAENIHLVYVSVTLYDLLHGGTLEMQLHSNIPQHNIKSLFGKQKNEYDEIN